MLLEIKDLRVSFPLDEGTVRAVEGVDLTIRRGEVLGVVGESGCGKSITAHSILRIIPQPGRIDSGQILFHPPGASSANENGVVDLAKLNPAGPEIRNIRGKDIAMIFQEPMSSFSPVHTIGSHITEAILLHQDVTPAKARQMTIELLRLVGISGAEQRGGNYPHPVSGGMRQRAMIAMALSCAPSLLIADEPTTALDVTIQAQILELVARLRESLHMAIIWITHDLGVVAGMADRVIVMYAGYIVEEADVQDLYDSPSHPYTLALLAALPRVDRRRDQRLKSIPGAPPNLLVEPSGCPFAPRCEFVIEQCLAENPPLMSV